MTWASADLEKSGELQNGAMVDGCRECGCAAYFDQGYNVPGVQLLYRCRRKCTDTDLLKIIWAT